MPAQRLSPECRLVFSTAGASVSDDAIAAIVGEPIDWVRVIVLAEREKAVSCVWRALQRTSPNVMPPEIAERFRKSGMITEFKMLLLEQQLRATLQSMRGRRVPGMLLKGAALGVSVYPSFVSRPMSDVDILVHADDVSRARAAIMASGWRDQGDPVLAELLVGHHHLPTFVDGNSIGLRLELHTALLPGSHPFQALENEIWTSATHASDTYADVLVPTPTHLLCYACLHFCWSHGMMFGAWRTFRDVNELIYASRIDWDELVSFARRTNAASACYWTLRLSATLTGSVVPAHVMAALRPPTSEWVFRALERHFIASIALGEGPPCPSVTLARQFWRMAMRPRWSGYGKATPSEGRNWELAMTGRSADAAPSRVVRHVAGARHWWNYVSQTLVQPSHRTTPTR